jgi:hypothetical protein
MKIPKPIPIRKIIGISLLVLIMLPFAWFLPTIISTIQHFFSQNPYTKVTVAGMVSIKIQDNSYGFEYFGQNQSTFNSYGLKPNEFAVIALPLLAEKTLLASAGATYETFGLEIKVSEVQSYYIVLLVRQL